MRTISSYVWNNCKTISGINGSNDKNRKSWRFDSFIIQLFLIEDRNLKILLAVLIYLGSDDTQPYAEDSTHHSVTLSVKNFELIFCQWADPKGIPFNWRENIKYFIITGWQCTYNCHSKFLLHKTQMSRIRLLHRIISFLKDFLPVVQWQQ